MSIFDRIVNQAVNRGVSRAVDHAVDKVVSDQVDKAFTKNERPQQQEPVQQEVIRPGDRTASSINRNMEPVAQNFANAFAGFGAMANMAAQQQAEASGMIMCTACGTPNKKELKFCGNCGNKLEMPKAICPSCGFENAAGTRFCGSCGARLQAEAENKPSVCPNCGAENEPGTKFCGSCGGRL
jgi:NADH pyrophosphatase NudC (nudix superfamily)